MRNRRRLLSDPEGGWEIWPSFTDVMSTMALILFVLVLLAYVRNLMSGRQIEAFRRQIDLSEQQLRTLNSQLARGKAELILSQAKLHDQQAVVADTSQKLEAVRSQLGGIAVLRVSVLEKVKGAIEAELGQTGDAGSDLVTIGDGGNILINESLVFEFDSYALKKDAKPLLDALGRAFANVLADSAVRGNIDTILIQGHTDERGSPSHNWDLSAKRATAVLDYLLETNKSLADAYGSYFAAAAYSKFRPIDAAPTDAAYAKNRRIEIAVLPKDDNVRKMIDDYMQSVHASAPTPPASP
ncbi:MAG: OmpA family protein [Polyangiaceae bacterium]